MISTPYMKKFGGLPAELRKDGTQKTALQIAPAPAKVADLVLFLASPSADAMSGEVIGVNGATEIEFEHMFY